MPTLHKKKIISADFEQQNLPENWQNVSKNGKNILLKIGRNDNTSE